MLGDKVGLDSEAESGIFCSGGVSMRQASGRLRLCLSQEVKDSTRVKVLGQKSVLTSVTPGNFLDQASSNNVGRKQEIRGIAI